MVGKDSRLIITSDYKYYLSSSLIDQSQDMAGQSFLKEDVGPEASGEG